MMDSFALFFMLCFVVPLIIQLRSMGDDIKAIRVLLEKAGPPGNAGTGAR
jgi:hypothetical protein